MSDETPYAGEASEGDDSSAVGREINSAEQEAEEILKEAFTNLDLNGEDCPQGDACAIHHRNDEEIIDEDIEFGRIITYVGEYAVITTDNPELENPIFLLKMILGQVSKDKLPDLYETCVIHVGDGALADLRTLDKDDRRKTIRFVQKHNAWENFKDAHNVVVNGVKEELIDVSKPAFPKED